MLDATVLLLESTTSLDSGWVEAKRWKVGEVSLYLSGAVSGETVKVYQSNGNGAVSNGSPTPPISQDFGYLSATLTPDTAGTALLIPDQARWIRCIKNTNTLLAPPATPTLSSVASGSLTAASNSVSITYVTSLGETAASATASISLSANNVFKVAAPGYPTIIAGIIGYNVYASISGSMTLQNSTPIDPTLPWQEPDSGLTTGGSLAPSPGTAYGQTTVVAWAFLHD